MAKKGKERIKEWRQRQKDQRYRRLNTYLSSEDSARLDKLKAHFKETIPETISRALIALEDSLPKGFP